MPSDASASRSDCTAIQRKLLFAVVLLFFFSGMTALAYEVLWARMLSLVFGGTVFAVSAVLTAFMLGLGLGSYWFGKIADRSENCLKLYAYLEFGIAAYAAATPLIFVILDRVHIAALTALQPARPLIVILRFTLAFMALIVPTIAMGATLPVISRFVVRHQSQIGSRVAILYGVNTAGAVIGCLLTGFIFIAAIGVRGTLYIVAATNLAVALVALFCSSRHSTPAGSSSEAPVPPSSALGRPNAAVPAELDSVATGSGFWARFLLLAAAVSGFTSLAYQVLWTRDHALVFSSTIYAFTIVVATFLTGLALGSLAISVLADRIRNPLFFFASVQILIGSYAVVFLDFALRRDMIYGVMSLVGIDPTPGTWADMVYMRFAISFVTMLLPTFLMGCAFPLIVKLYNSNYQTLGRGIGQIYGANMLGCVLGAFAAGFLLIPLTGARPSIYLVGALSISTGLIAYLSDPSLKVRTKSLACVVGLVLAGGAFLFSLSRDHAVGKPNAVRLYSREGIDALVEVVTFPGMKVRLLTVNNVRSLGSSAPTGLSLQRREGHLPLLLHQDPQDVLVIGFATGSTSGAVMLHQDVRSLDCVEIIADLQNTAHFFSDANHDVLDDERFRFIAEDGRTYVRTTGKTYDVIVSDLFQAADAGVGNLFTKEHFLACHQRLKEDGLMCQWLPSDQLSPQNLDILINTFLQVFPDATLWFADVPDLKGIMGIIGTKSGPLEIDVGRLTQRLRHEAIRGELKPILLDEPHGLLSAFIMGSEQLKQLTAGAPLNTDDRPRIEFSAPRDRLLGQYGVLHVPFMIDKRESVLPLLTNIARSPDEAAIWKAQHAKFFRAKTHTLRAQCLVGQRKFKIAANEFRKAVAACPEYSEARFLAQRVPWPPGSLRDPVK